MKMTPEEIDDAAETFSRKEHPEYWRDREDGFKAGVEWYSSKHSQKIEDIDEQIVHRLVLALREAFLWDSHDSEGVEAVWFTMAQTALSAYESSHLKKKTNEPS